MSNEIYLKDAEIMGDKVKMIYQDDSELFVSKTDYDRAFGPIISSPKARELNLQIIGVRLLRFTDIKSIISYRKEANYERLKISFK